MPARAALRTLSTNQAGLQEKQIKRIQNNPMKKIQGSPKIFKESNLKGNKVGSKQNPLAVGKENIISRLKTKPGAAKRFNGDKCLAKPLEKIVSALSLNGFITPKIILEAEARLPEDVDDIDKNDFDNPQLCAEYAVDIHNYLNEVESRPEIEIRDNFLAGCPVNGKMRSVLVDWLVEVQQQFKLLQETLFLTLNIVDRYLNREGKNVHKSQLQLIGVSAMFLASKIEEIYAPEISDFVYITDDTYSAQEIRHTEFNILNVLEFRFNQPFSITFLRRFSKAGDVDIVQHNLAKYILELAMVEYPLVPLRPSLLAAAALHLSLIMTDKTSIIPESVWDPKLQYYTNYSSSQLMSTIVRMANLLVDAPGSKYKAVCAKYSSTKLMKVSQLPQLSGDVLLRLIKH